MGWIKKVFRHLTLGLFPQRDSGLKPPQEVPQAPCRNLFSATTCSGGQESDLASGSLGLPVIDMKPAITDVGGSPNDSSTIADNATRKQALFALQKIREAPGVWSRLTLLVTELDRRECLTPIREILVEADLANEQCRLGDGADVSRDDFIVYSEHLRHACKDGLIISSNDPCVIFTVFWAMEGMVFRGDKG